jgi:hypothetical protein
VKGEKIPHSSGFYTARRDPRAGFVWCESRSVLVRYTHQFTETVLELAWNLWQDYMTQGGWDGGRAFTPPLPPPRLRWLCQVPCNPSSIEADEGFTYLYHPAKPGQHGAFPCIEFNEHTLAWEEYSRRPPRVINVHLPEAVPTP